jgi:hypothetical protein
MALPLIEVERYADSFDSSKPLSTPLKIINRGFFTAYQITSLCNIVSATTNRNISIQNVVVVDNQTPIQTFTELKELKRGKSDTAFCSFSYQGLEIETIKFDFVIQYKFDFVIQYKFLFWPHREEFGYAVNNVDGKYIWTDRDISRK